MNNTHVGGKAPSTDTQPIETTVASETNNSNISSQTASSPSIAEDLEALQRLTAIESLATTAWQSLTSQQKEQVVNQATSNLLEKQPQIYSQMPKQALRNYILGLVKHRLGEMLYKANTNNLTSLLQSIGQKQFESLEDYEQAELLEAKIDKIEYFYNCCVATQQELLEEICEEIYLELGIGEMAKV
jgi:hypothetical protein